jgi:hypothetical protein
VRITKRDSVHVPWLEVARSPTAYLDVDTIPDGFKVLDPSKLTKAMIFELWCHWSARAMAKLPILIFIKARHQDLGLSAQWDLKRPQAAPKRKAIPYVDVGSDDQASNDELDGHGNGKDVADKGEGTSGSSIRQPPSKRPRHSGHTAVPDKQSPAANSSDRPKFLSSLSPDPSYKALVDGILALPVFVSTFFFFICMNLPNYSYT